MRMKSFSETNISSIVQSLETSDDFVFLDCARVSDEEYRTLLFKNPKQWLICADPDQAESFMAEADLLRSQGYYLAGWLGYEFGYLLEPSLADLCPENAPYASLGVFEKPFVVDHRSGDQPFSSTVLPGGETRGEGSFTIDNIHTNIAREEYLQAIDKIREYIVAGDTYQVNYTMKLLFNFNGSPAGLYNSLRRNQAVSYGAWIRQAGRDIMSFSPELFFRANGERITVRPMKGTMKRGRSLVEDVRQREALHDDLKNRSENVMIVDLLRNDLGRLLHATGGGEVRPRSIFDVEVYDTLLQMTSTVDGVPSQRNVPDLQNILSALFPCGSVTGAPKIRTMEIIHELEKEPRGVYCGAIGFSGPEESVFNVPIRTVVLDGNDGQMGIGSGIVSDSDPESEWQESLLKAQFLTTRQPDFQLIETLLWSPDSGYWLLDEHMRRLSDSAKYYLFAHDIENVLDLLKNEAQSFSSFMRVRLLLYRDGRVSITATQLADHVKPSTEPEILSRPLPQVVFSTCEIDKSSVQLYHKTTQRTLYDKERAIAIEAGFYEVLYANSEGEVTEGSVSNIFIYENGRLLTPPVGCGLLAGTFRAYLLKQKKAEEMILTIDRLKAAEAVFVGNSVRGLVQVEVVNDYLPAD